LTEITCLAITTADASNATWPVSQAGVAIAGRCLAGYTGTPTRTCTTATTQPGTWGAALTSCARTFGVDGRGAATVSPNTLTRRTCDGTRPSGVPTAVYCAATDYTGDADLQASFPSVLAGTSAVGTCAAGLFGLPQLLCQPNGQWDTTSLQNPCSGTTERIRVMARDTRANGQRAIAPRLSGARHNTSNPVPGPDR